ncbi:hypothetical protein BOTBODRAFT_33765 [Botryobasidium botryosum FD-172 SS1]|uniref:BTB domain-containing protein n=1 Tax=Botryobasidium botryosum (strain FD-172 SS1) TaxID=930990 RepID=A0A067MMN8_BOTB1|nr:hypothetical protein BOTBODRAFT_33765 [Botryobasidium botryosum FD-172 SS1]
MEGWKLQPAPRVRPVRQKVPDGVTQGPLRHEELYFDGEHITLALGPRPTLFRVLRSLLVTQSDAFRDMLGIPQPGDETPEGSSDTNPVHLPDDPDDFACLLKFYYQHFLVTSLSKKPPCAFVLSVWRVSSKYLFHKASEWALEHLRDEWLEIPHKTPATGQTTRDALLLILTSRSVGSTEFLPSAFYHLCALQPDDWDTSFVSEGCQGLARSDLVLLAKGSRAWTLAWGVWCMKRRDFYVNVTSSSAALQSSKDFLSDQSVVRGVLEAMGFERAG